MHFVDEAERVFPKIRSALADMSAKPIDLETDILVKAMCELT